MGMKTPGTYVTYKADTTTNGAGTAKFEVTREGGYTLTVDGDFAMQNPNWLADQVAKAKARATAMERMKYAQQALFGDESDLMTSTIADVDNTLKQPTAHEIIQRMKEVKDMMQPRVSSLPTLRDVCRLNGLTFDKAVDHFFAERAWTREDEKRANAVAYADKAADEQYRAMVADHGAKVERINKPGIIPARSREEALTMIEQLKAKNAQLERTWIGAQQEMELLKQEVSCLKATIEARNAYIKLADGKLADMAKELTDLRKQLARKGVRTHHAFDDAKWRKVMNFG